MTKDLFRTVSDALRKAIFSGVALLCMAAILSSCGRGNPTRLARIIMTSGEYTNSYFAKIQAATYQPMYYCSCCFR